MSFLCPRCGALSHHPEDEKQGYCGACHNYTAFKAGNVLRIRRAQSEDDWCICTVLLAADNGQALGLRVVDGALRTANGGLIAGAVAVAIDPLTGAYEAFTNTPIDIEGRA